MRWFAGFGRLVRGLWPDRNPLRRRSDRVEAAVAALLLLGLLGGVPAATLTAGSWAYGLGMRAEHAQQAERHQVPATVLENAVLGPWPVRVEARWTAPDGTSRTGLISVPGGTASGSTVTVWTDASGQLQAKPLRHSAVIALAAFTSVWVALMMGLLLFGAWRWSRRRLERRRMSAWDADWRVTGPRWTNRR